MAQFKGQLVRNGLIAIVVIAIIVGASAYAANLAGNQDISPSTTTGGQPPGLQPSTTSTPSSSEGSTHSTTSSTQTSTTTISTASSTIQSSAAEQSQTVTTTTSPSWSSASVSTSTASASGTSNHNPNALNIRQTFQFSDDAFVYDSSNDYTYGIDTNLWITTSPANVSGDYQVSVFNGRTFVENISLPCIFCYAKYQTTSGGSINSYQTDTLSQIVYNPSTNLIFVFETYNNAHNSTTLTYVHAINGSTNSVTANYKLGGIHPLGLASDTTNPNLYLYTYTMRGYAAQPELYVLDGRTGSFIANVTNGLVSRSSSGAIGFDSSNHNLYTSDGQVINTQNYEVANFTGGQTDVSLASFNPTNDFVYMGWNDIIMCCTPRNATVMLVNGSTNYFAGWPGFYPPNVQVQGSSQWSVDDAIFYNAQNGDTYVASSTQGNYSASYLTEISSKSNTIVQSVATPNLIFSSFDPSHGLYFGVNATTQDVVIASVS